MDFSKLGQNEKLAVYGSAALIIGGIIGYSYGLTALGMLAAVAMLVIVFLPQLSPGTALPGSRGSLMVAVGGLAGVVMVLALLQAVGAVLVNTNLRDVFFLVAVAGGVLMAWAGWQEFQAEGGKFRLASRGSAAAPSAPAEARANDAATAEPAAVDHAERRDEATAVDPAAASGTEPQPEREAEPDRPSA